MSSATDLSLGEFGALVAKAFRGAGYSWGLTEDASFAAKRLGESGLPAADLVVGLLEAVDGRDPTSLMPHVLAVERSTIVCPICVGVCLADLRSTSAFTSSVVANVVAPALVAPLVAVCLTPGERSSYVIEWDTGRCEAWFGSIVMSGSHPDHAVDIQISTRDTVVEPVELHRRVVLERPTLEALERFAHRTYAPDTEASRIAGAGPS